VEYEGKKLKVILISGGAWGDHSHDFPDAYQSYLGALTSTLPELFSTSAGTTLMAYDLLNEPESVWPEDTIGHSKQDVCEKVKMWYNTVKAGDPDHLVTMGGQGHFDITEWDNAVYSLDFCSPHLYPTARQFEEPTYFESLMNSYYGKLYWVSNTFRMPWIIGETGFRAIEGSVFDTIYDGTLTDQYDFADSSTARTWICGGSGYSWWFYQDVNDDGFGILKQNETCGNWPCNSILKPVWEVFDEFTPPSTGNCSQPPYYFDPFYHDMYAPDTNIVTGYVKDRAGNPIKDAVVFAHTRLWDPPNNDVPKFDWHYTFTDEDGFFRLIPYDYDIRGPDYNTIECITISAPVCSRFRAEKWGPWGGVDSGQTYYLDRFDLNEEESFESMTIYGNESVVLQAWDYISLTDVEIEQNATCEAKTRIEITVNQEFSVASGSETWLHIGTPFIPCDSLANFTDSSYRFFTDNNHSVNEINSKNSKDIALNFIPFREVFGIEAFPNPGTGIFNIAVQCSMPMEDMNLFVIDTYGEIVYTALVREQKVQLDLSHLARGLYFIQIKNSTHSMAKKIIIH